MGKFNFNVKHATLNLNVLRCIFFANNSKIIVVYPLTWFHSFSLAYKIIKMRKKDCAHQEKEIFLWHFIFGMILDGKKTKVQSVKSRHQYLHFSKKSCQYCGFKVETGLK